MGRVLEGRLHEVTLNDMQCSFMPEKRMIGVLFTLRMLQEDNCAKGNMCMCFLYMD